MAKLETCNFIIVTLIHSTNTGATFEFYLHSLHLQSLWQMFDICRKSETILCPDFGRIEPLLLVKSNVRISWSYVAFLWHTTDYRKFSNHYNICQNSLTLFMDSLCHKMVWIWHNVDSVCVRLWCWFLTGWFCY